MITKPINIVSATQIGPYRLHLVFDDNAIRDVDFEPFLKRSHHPDIRHYLEPALFSGYKVQHGDLVWGDYDLCFPVIDIYHNAIAQ